MDEAIKYYAGQVGADSYLVADSDAIGYTDVIKLVGFDAASFAVGQLIALSLSERQLAAVKGSGIKSADSGWVFPIKVSSELPYFWVLKTNPSRSAEAHSLCIGFFSATYQTCFSI
ncbi:MAG: hypothetical protein ACJAY7_000707 [Pseudohongiellaceae bacterium]